MASTYVNDLRLNEMATGDGSGTWGTTTNTNLELIAEAFSYGTEAITTNADTHTTTIADGASDPGRALYLKYTGTLDSACTITIGPNTVSKVWIIENGTSGSQNIIISQGSGANITIPAGDTKVVYSDGAGAGAAFFDAFASLSVVDLKVQDDLTVTDDASIGGDATITGTLGVTGNITGTLATAAQPNITSVGTLTALAGGTGDLNWDSGTLFVDSSADAVGIGTTSPSGKFEVKGSGTSPIVYFGNGVDNAPNRQLAFSGGSSGLVWDLDATGSSSVGGQLTLSTNGTERLRIDSSGNVGIGTSSPTSSFNVASANGAAPTNTSGTNVVRLTSTTTAAVGVGPSILFEGQTGNTTTNYGFAGIQGLKSSATPGNYGGDLAFFTQNSGGGSALTEHMRIDSSGNVGIGMSPTASGNYTILDIKGKAIASSAILRFYDGAGTNTGAIQSDTNYGVLLAAVGAKPLSFFTNATERMRIDASGRVTMPLQPAFQVRPASLQSNIAVDTAVTIVLGTEAFDVGSNFASNTFTAPVTGKYQFNVELRLDNIDTAAGYYHLNLITSNRTYFSIVDPGVLASDPAYWSLGLSVLADMDASDTAYVVIYQAGGTAQTDINNDAGNTIFSGYLAC
jgi:hypothetical protein